MRQTRNSKVSRLTAQLNDVKKQLSGRVFSPPTDPRSFVVIPWNSATIRFTTGSNSGTLLVSDVLFNLQEQQRLFGTTSGTTWRVPVEYRFRTIKAYSVEPKVKIEVILFDFTNADNGSLTTLSDTGTQANPAKVGYEYPNRVTSNAMFGTTESGRTVSTYASSNGAVTFYITLMWRAY